MAQDYKNTLNLPETEFAMRANLPAREPEVFASWDADGLYYRIIENKMAFKDFAAFTHRYFQKHTFIYSIILLKNINFVY